ncbi:MAG: hypothetical protein IK079_04665 [Desulfovibrio sp.]|nr:hypothetical protein [Desulfovibrio sp.]
MTLGSCPSSNHKQGLGSSAAKLDETQSQLRVHQKNSSASATDKKTAQGDIVDISEEGVEKSKTIQAAFFENSGKTNTEGKNSASVDMASQENINIDDIQKTLQQKNSEVTVKQAKLEMAKRAAEEDPSKEGEAKRLQSQISDLEKEVKKLKSEVYQS